MSSIRVVHIPGIASATSASLLLATSVLVIGCGEPEPEPEVLRPVRSQTVAATSGSRERTFSGMARAGQETELSFRVPGTVRRVSVEVGSRVNARDLIASLDPEDYDIAVEQAEANLRQAQATERNAEADLDRVRGLFENNNASQNDYDAALAGAESARAQVEASAKALQSAQRQRGYTVLRAPVDGAIASVDVEVNENLQPGERVVLLASGAQPEVEVAMPEVLIAGIREGDVVTVTFDAIPDEGFIAVVTEVGVAATGAATTFPVTVRLSSANERVRSGMAANVTFSFESDHGGRHIHLPTHAVGEDREGRFVFVVETADEPGVGIVRRTSVDVGEATGEELEIVSGLSEGQRVVTAGARRLTDGQRVRILEDSGTSP